MKKQFTFLIFDPIPALLESNNNALIFFTKRDLINERVSPSNFEKERDVLSILRKQTIDGYWKYPGNVNVDMQVGYNQLETFRQIGFLIDKYNFDRNHPSIQKAAEFLFSCQSSDGDFRGIYGHQYAPTYSSTISALLIKAGYENDTRLLKSLDWLLEMRQDDGGWAIPLRTKKMGYYYSFKLKEPLEPDRTKPFSHLITGCALLSLAIHPKYNRRADIIHAGKLLMSRFFKRDKYADRSAVSFWTGFSYPYWFTDLLTSLDILSNLDFTKDEPEITKAIDWFVQNQSKDGTWEKLHLIHGRDPQQYLWLTLQIVRVLKRFF